jgi:hypothetical protein
MAPYCVLDDQIVAVRPFLLERRLRASTRNGGRSAGSVDAITAPQRSCRDGLGTRMGREGRRRALEPSIWREVLPERVDIRCAHMY